LNRDKFMTRRNSDAFVGCLLGTAVGDALGLPYEGLSPRRAKKLFPDTTKHHFFFGKGMVSDDTEHACFAAQAIIRSKGSVDEFQRQLARSLRRWFIGLPAGIGFATLRSIIKLWLGISPEKSGVFSAGNGPSMRSPILGVAFRHDPEKLKSFVKASTEITHSDPKACYAALAVAQASINVTCADDDWQEDLQNTLRKLMPEPDAEELHDLFEKARVSARNNEPVNQFAESIGSKNGISGYSYHTVPCVFQVWFKHENNFENGLQEIIKAGGDTDTAGAIYGGIVGGRSGKQCIPEDWLKDIIEWPRTIDWIQRLGIAVSDTVEEQVLTRKSPRYFKPGILVRNLFFLLVVLAHGFRRLAPPY
jgi:ADP-ribosyl-[dinitrogen reductase] hydrolase